MPGVLRFGKRSQSFVRFGRDVGSVDKKEMPGVLRFGKRSAHAKKAVPGNFFTFLKTMWHKITVRPKY